MPQNTPASTSLPAPEASQPGSHWWAGQLVGWLLTAVVVSYAIWFFGFATVYGGPHASLPVQTVESDRPFGDLQAMLAPLRASPEKRIGKAGLARPTVWLTASVPRGVRGQGRTIHFTEKNVARGEAALLNSSGEAVLWSMFGVGLSPLEAHRALPGFAMEVPRDWNDIDDLTLVMRIEPVAVANNIGVDLWSTKQFQDAQFKTQQRTVMLIGALLLLTVYALAAAQAGRVKYLLVFAFWLVARCGYVISAGGFGYFSFGVAAGTPLGLGLRQFALLSFIWAVATLAWSITQAELQGSLARKVLHKAVILSCCAALVVGFLPSQAFQLTLWVTAGTVIAAVLMVIYSGLRRIDNRTTRWYLAGLMMDVAAALNELTISLGFTSPWPWFGLQQVSLISAMLTGVAVGSLIAKERERRLQAQEAAIEVLGKYESVYRTVPIGLISFGPDDRAERYNDGFARMFGLPGAEVAVDMQAINRGFPISLRNRIRAELGGVGECDFPYRLGNEADGRWLRIMARGSPAAFEASITDITEHKNTEKRLAHAAEHDALTGALNRRGLGRRIARHIESGGDITQLSLVYLDLDRFKLLNDLFGHRAGDTVLQEVVGRLQAALGPKTAVARLGGDEFAALLDPDVADRHEDLARLALHVIASQTFQIPPKSFSVTASVGMFRFAPGLTAEALIAGADRACLDAKRKGRNQVVIQNDASALIQRQIAELSVLADLRDSDTLGDFELTVQPILSLRDPRRLGGEVLLRHRAADGSLQPPVHLIGAAEGNGEIANIDRWVLRQSLGWLSRHGERFGTLDFLSLNLSACSLNDEFFKTFVLALLRKHHHVAHLAVIEITESAAMQDVFVLEKFIAQVRETGARLALDDFGSGYSSLASLSDVGASYLKIDGKFVEALSKQGASTRVVRTINVLAHELGMECIATAIDDAATLSLLGELGADYGQGAALCPPLSLPAFEAMCAGGRPEQSPAVQAIFGDDRGMGGLNGRRRAHLPVTAA